MKWGLSVFFLCFLSPFAVSAKPQCLLFLSPEISRSDRQIEIEAIAQRMLQQWAELKGVQKAKSFRREWFLGQGGEGAAYLMMQPRQRHLNVVHKYFYPETWGRSAHRLSTNVKSLKWLRQYKDQGLLGNLEIVELYGVSESRLAMYLEYIPGESILNLTHRRVDQNTNWSTPSYELRKDLGFAEKDVLRRFDAEALKVIEAWEALSGVVIEAHRIEVDGHFYTVVALIKDQRTGDTIIDLNIMNTVYDTHKDRLVIVDPR